MFPCGHHSICAICGLKQRHLLKTPNCLMCNTPQDICVIKKLSQTLGMTASSRRQESFQQQHLSAVSDVAKHASVNRPRGRQPLRHEMKIRSAARTCLPTGTVWRERAHVSGVPRDAAPPRSRLRAGAGGIDVRVPSVPVLEGAGDRPALPVPREGPALARRRAAARVFGNHEVGAAQLQHGAELDERHIQ